MVKHRGIEVNVVSQFDAMRLPDFRPAEKDRASNNATALQLEANSTASVYIPMHPGSQFWFEYKIDGPHPPNAIYFFKMLYKGQILTSWDTTEKVGFQGKVMMALRYLGNDPFTGKPQVQREVFQFSACPKDANDRLDDCIDIGIYRVEHRQKTALEKIATTKMQIDGNVARDKIKLQNGGLLDAVAPKKYYRYQLLDPLDSPYVRFCFYFRTVDELKEAGIISAESASALIPSGSQSTIDSTDNSTQLSQRSSLESTRSLHDHNIIDMSEAACRLVKPHGPGNVKPEPPTISVETSSPSPNAAKSDIEEVTTQSKLSKPRSSYLNVDYSDRAPSPRTLSSFLKAPITPSFLKSACPGSPIKRRSLTKPPPLTISLDGVEFDISKKARRPLSPFTAAGLLRRKAVSPTPPTAPPSVTTFTIEDEVAEMEALARAKSGQYRPRKKEGEEATKTARDSAAAPLGGLFRRARMRKMKEVVELSGDGI